LQVLDDGHITDSQGRKVDFKNTIIILTSNLGSSLLLEGIDEDGNISQKASDEVNELVKRSFRPEFVNRLDEIILYKPLTKKDITSIIDLFIEGLNKRLADKEIKCILTEDAKNHIIENGYDAVYGARPLRRYIQKNIETLIARKIIENCISPSSTVTVDIQNNNFILR
jgi:ATP-dependent Clp protease ATP-binding subunit ClpB